jgi:hypothetical protein
MGNPFDRSVMYTGNRFGISVDVSEIGFIYLGVYGLWGITWRGL